jgi:hypothetical protein
VQRDVQERIAVTKDTPACFGFLPSFVHHPDFKGVPARGLLSLAPPYRASREKSWAAAVENHPFSP